MDSIKYTFRWGKVFKLGIGLCLFLVLLGMTYGITSQVSSFFLQSNPFNITFNNQFDYTGSINISYEPFENDTHGYNILKWSNAFGTTWKKNITSYYSGTSSTSATDDGTIQYLQYNISGFEGLGVYVYARINDLAVANDRQIYLGIYNNSGLALCLFGKVYDETTYWTYKFIALNYRTQFALNTSWNKFEIRIRNNRCNFFLNNVYVSSIPIEIQQIQNIRLSINADNTGTTYQFDDFKIYNFTNSSGITSTQYISIPKYSYLSNLSFYPDIISNKILDNMDSTSNAFNNLLWTPSLALSNFIYDTSKKASGTGSLAMIDDGTSKNVQFIFNGSRTNYLDHNMSVSVYMAMNRTDIPADSQYFLDILDQSDTYICRIGKRYNVQYLSAYNLSGLTYNQLNSNALNTSFSHFKILLNKTHCLYYVNGAFAFSSPFPNLVSYLYKIILSINTDAQPIKYNFDDFRVDGSPIKDITYKIGDFESNNILSDINLSANISQVNSILSSGCSCTNCSIIGSNCNIPIVFRSDTLNIETLNLTNASISYGIDNCSNYTYPIMNFTYFDQKTLSPITLTNTYTLYASSPFTQTIAGTFNGAYSNSICSLVNYSANNFNYSIYGSLVLEKSGYQSKIIQNDIVSPYLISTSPYSLPLYLTDTGNTSTTTITVKDFNSNLIISGVKVEMYQVILGVPVLVGSQLTDVTGNVQFSYLASQLYRFNFTASNYNSYSFDLNPILSSTYTVFLTKSSALNVTTQYDNLIVEYSPQVFYENQSNSFEFAFISSTNQLTGYSVRLDYPSGTQTQTGSNARGETFNFNFTINGADLDSKVKLTYFYTTPTAGTLQYEKYLPIILVASNNTMMANLTNTYGLGIFERLLIATLFVLGTVGIAALVGQIMPGVILGLMIFSYFVMIGFIPLWSILISAFAGIILISSRSS